MVFKFSGRVWVRLIEVALCLVFAVRDYIPTLSSFTLFMLSPFHHRDLMLPHHCLQGILGIGGQKG